MGIELSKNTRADIMSGIDASSNLIKSTMGAKGRTVVITDEFRLTPRYTKDGVSIARAIKPTNTRFFDVGVSIVKDSAEKTVDSAGDGTTTTTVLLQALCHEIDRQIGLGVSFKKIKKELLEDKDIVIDFIKKNSSPLTSSSEILNIAKISSNNDVEVSNIISDIFEKEGFDLTVDVRKNDSDNTFYEVVNGISIPDSGFIVDRFVNSTENNRIEYENARVVLFNGVIKTTTSELTSILSDNQPGTDNLTPLVIVVQDVDDQMLNQILTAISRGSITKVAIVKSNLIGEYREEYMQDASAFLGGGYSETNLIDGGRCDKVIITKHETTFIGGHGDTTDYISELEAKSSRSNGGFKASIDRRLFNLKSKAAILKVGGSLDTEISERKDRAEDAVLAVKSAISSGYSPGGGLTLFEASQSCEFKGSVLKSVLDAPIRQMLTNADLKPDVIIGNLINLPFPRGYNLETDEYGDLLEMGVIDSTNVIIESVKNSINSACLYSSIGGGL